MYSAFFPKVSEKSFLKAYIPDFFKKCPALGVYTMFFLKVWQVK